MTTDFPYYYELDVYENALMQAYALDYKWFRKAPDVEFVRNHHLEKLRKMKAEMRKCPHAEKMLAVLRLYKMVVADKDSDLIPSCC